MARYRLTESRLRGLIRESIKQVLREGKVENNKPFFDKYYSNVQPKGRKVKPGEHIYNGLDKNGASDFGNWDLRGNYTPEMKKADDEIFNQIIAAFKSGDEEEGYRLFKQAGNQSYRPNYDKLQQAMQKHNERAANSYMYNGNHSEDSDRLHTLWGSPEQQDEKHQMELKQRREMAEMLQVNGISLKEYQKMSEEQKGECWDYYRDWSSPRNRRAREWNEMGDPNWDQIYDNL